jgi:DNA-binding NtrC family response regulator/ligand-binding sensor domain-containing protein
MSGLPQLAAAFLAAAGPAYLQSSWTTEHGLPQNTVTRLLQTRDGYLWLGTLGGLVRFDGVRFTVYTAATTPALQSNRIQALAEDNEGTLWIGSEAGGIVRMRRGAFEALPGNALLPDPFVQAFHMARDGSVWAGTARGLVRIQGARVTDYTAPAQLPLPNVQAFAEDADGTLWIGTTGGLVQFREGAPPRRFGTAEGLPERVVKALHRGDDGTLWVATTKGAARLRDGAFVELLSQEGRSLGRTTAFARDAEGALWIAAGPSGAFKLEGERAVAHPGAERVADNQTQSLLADREGTLWLGTNRSGLERWRRRGVTMLSSAHGLGTGVLPILQDRRGAVWVGAYCGGLTRLEADGVARYDKPAGLANTCITALHEDGAGRLWVGTEGGGLYSFDGARFAAHGGPELFGPRVSAIQQDRAGRLWIGSARGLLALQDGRFTRYAVRDGLVHDDVRIIKEDRAGALWVGTTGGLSRLQDGRFTNYTARSGLSNDYVREIYEDADGVLWIGSYGGGLTRLESGRFTHFTRQAGLFDEVVSRILVDDRDRFWMSGNRGVFRTSHKELNDYAAGRIRSISCIAYGVADGMASGESQGGGSPAGWKGRDGRLWFPTLAGVAVFDPRLLANEIEPPIAIEEVQVDGRPFDARDEAALAAGARSLEIRYTALSLVAPEKLRFRYRLFGHDEDWVDAGGRRAAYYTNLPPRRYRFEVIAANDDGVWNETGAALSVVQRPRFHQTWAFYALCGVVLAGAGAGGHRLRVRALTRRTRELEAHVAERTAEVVRQKDQLAALNLELERGRDDLLATFDRLHVGVLVVSQAGLVSFVSRAAHDVLGGRGPLDGHWHDVLPLGEDDRRRLTEMLDAPRARRAKLPIRLAAASGRQYWMEVEIEDDPRDPERRIFFLYDVSEVYDLRRLLDDKARFHGLVGQSAAMQLLFKQIRDVAAVDTTVLIEGETGTGKELVARAIHYQSARKSRPFVAINCAGLTESLLASQLFGHRRGAFTGAVADQVGHFEAAQGGTVFLDEIGDIAPSAQMSLLRVLQEREIARLGESQPRKIDVRVIAASNRDLVRATADGRFRQDLLYRIRVARIEVPPLRARKDDIPMLAAWFLSECRQAVGREVRDVSAEAMEILVEHAWPGNVRELKAAVETAVIHAAGCVIQPGDLPRELLLADADVPAGDPAIRERERLKRAFRDAGGNRSEMARLLGISRATLYRRLASLNLELKDTP